MAALADAPRMTRAWTAMCVANVWPCTRARAARPETLAPCLTLGRRGSVASRDDKRRQARACELHAPRRQHAATRAKGEPRDFLLRGHPAGRPALPAHGGAQPAHR